MKQIVGFLNIWPPICHVYLLMNYFGNKSFNWFYSLIPFVTWDFLYQIVDFLIWEYNATYQLKCKDVVSQLLCQPPYLNVHTLIASHIATSDQNLWSRKMVRCPWLKNEKLRLPSPGIEPGPQGFPWEVRTLYPNR